MRITKITQQQRRTDRLSVYVDEKYCFSLAKDQLAQKGLRVGQELTKSEISKLKEESSYGKLRDLTLRWLSLRPRSKYEIEQYLKRKSANQNHADKLVSELEGFGYINDHSFAKSWVRSRKALKPISAYRLKQELLIKRVELEIIEEVIDNEEHDDLNAAIELINKKRHRYSDEQKLIAYLARQGFRYEIIRQALDDAKS